MTRPFELPDGDQEFLDALGLAWEIVDQGKKRGVIVHDFAVPATYRPQTADLMIVIPPNYPTAELDMFWLSPPIERIDGRGLQKLVAQSLFGRSWQRWSRHRTGRSKWRPGVDCLATHLQLVMSILETEGGQ